MSAPRETKSSAGPEGGAGARLRAADEPMNRVAKTFGEAAA